MGGVTLYVHTLPLLTLTRFYIIPKKKIVCHPFLTYTIPPFLRGWVLPRVYINPKPQSQEGICPPIRKGSSQRGHSYLVEGIKLRQVILSYQASSSLLFLLSQTIELNFIFFNSTNFCHFFWEGKGWKKKRKKKLGKNVFIQ